MAEPRKKLSKTRTHLRRSRYEVGFVSSVVCPNCHEPVLPHTICGNCGFYRGRVIKKELPTKRILAEDDNKKEK